MAKLPAGPANRVRWLAWWWSVAVVAGAGYGLFLGWTAQHRPHGDPLTGQFPGQPVVKASMAVMLAVAAAAAPVDRERRWLVPALALSALGDFLLALRWWEPSFVGGLAAFLLAHLCFLGVLVPLAAPSRSRVLAALLAVLGCAGLLTWFWPHLAADRLTVPVTLYIAVLGAMVCAALLARLPTPWTALGAVCFAVSDAMIGTSEFVRHDHLLAVPIWVAYATAMVLITAGLFFRRHPPAMSAGSATPAG
jgi:uncharacterized membrane protein YhhN